MGRLTTHVLDTARGMPAAGLSIELWDMEPTPRLRKTVTTNSDGRTDQPLLADAEFKPGLFELRFLVGAYLKQTSRQQEPAFLDVVPVRFGIADASQHYHVPLLLSPFGYSTYRGS